MNTADGSGQTNLTNNADADDYAPAFSPDGTKVVFTSFWIPNYCPPGGYCARVPLGDGGIMMMNADGSGQTLLSNSPHDERPDWGASVQEGTLWVDWTVPSEYLKGVSRDTNVEAHFFGWNMDPATINTDTFTLVKQGTTTPVEATVTYDEWWQEGADPGLWALLGVATLDPQADLEANTTYTATLRGGENGIKDTSGVLLAEDYSWSFTTTDTTPPETTIISGPNGLTNDNTPTYDFTSDDPEATFGCRLTKHGDTPGSFAACTSPSTYPAQNDGTYTFEVRAKDQAGNEDGSPAEHSFTVDATAPTGTVSINDGVSRTRTQSVTLTLSATDPSPGSRGNPDAYQQHSEWVKLGVLGGLHHQQVVGVELWRRDQDGLRTVQGWRWQYFGRCARHHQV